MRRTSKDVRKQTWVVPEGSTFQEEGATIARALGQACACVYEEQEEAPVEAGVVRVNGRKEEKGGEEKGREAFPLDDTGALGEF